MWTLKVICRWDWDDSDEWERREETKKSMIMVIILAMPVVLCFVVNVA